MEEIDLSKYGIKNNFFDKNQEVQIVLGIKNLKEKGVKDEDIKELISLYADEKFNWNQMDEIRLGIEYLIDKGVGVAETKELIS
ncbi:MAG: hypothetical protein QW474_00155, partial [Candidatus Aenigmatarchaeota archaeon]